jgi:isoquinoline 1-oxidoreductase subunit beta
MGLKRMLNVAKDDAGFASEGGVSRRTFLKVGAAASGGLLIGFYLPAVRAAPATAATAGTFAPNAFVRIGRDDTVTLIMPQVEMGQGTYTSMPMLIAEELEVDLGQIALEAAPADDRRYANPIYRVPGHGRVHSVRATWEPIRRAGAVARIMLISAAAQGWNVDPTSCHAEKGEVVHGPTGRKLSYGALADTAAALPVPDNVALKDAKAFKLVGTPAKRLDTPDKPLFGIDVKIPGMKSATVAACPVFGGKLARVDEYRNRDQWRPPGGAPRRCRCNGRRPYVGGDSRPSISPRPWPAPQ